MTVFLKHSAHYRTVNNSAVWLHFDANWCPFIRFVLYDSTFWCSFMLSRYFNIDISNRRRQKAVLQ